MIITYSLNNCVYIYLYMYNCIGINRRKTGQNIFMKGSRGYNDYVNETQSADNAFYHFIHFIRKQTS